MYPPHAMCVYCISGSIKISLQKSVKKCIHTQTYLNGSFRGFGFGILEIKYLCTCSVN